MSDLIRSRTEVECIVEDLQQADERGNEKREDLEKELKKILKKITNMEAELMEIVPDYQDCVREENDEKRR